MSVARPNLQMSNARWIILLALVTMSSILIFRYELGFSFGYEDCMRSAASHASTNSAADRLQNLCYERYVEPYQTREPSTFRRTPLAKWAEVISSDAYLKLDSDGREALRLKHRNDLALRSLETGASRAQVQLHLAKFDAHSQPTILNKLQLWWIEACY